MTTTVLAAMLTLFNGQNLDGWNVLAGKWTVRDGAMVCLAAPGSIRSAFESDAFTLSFSYRRAASGRNWVLVHSGPGGGGVAVDLDPDRFVGGLGMQVPPAGDWMRMEIQVGSDVVRASLELAPGRTFQSTRRVGPAASAPSGPGQQDVPRGFIRFEATEPGLEIREVRASEPGFTGLLDGDTLKGWEVVGQKKGRPANWSVEQGTVICRGQGGNWLRTLRSYDNFVLRLDYQVPAQGNSGVYLRAPLEGRVSQIGLEIQLVDDRGWPGGLKPAQRTGAVYSGIAPEVQVPAPAGAWNAIEVLCDGKRIRTVLNGVQLYDARLDDARKDAKLLGHPLTTRRAEGFIGLQDHTGAPRFRDLRIRELPGRAQSAPAAARPGQ